MGPLDPNFVSRSHRLRSLETHDNPALDDGVLCTMTEREVWFGWPCIRIVSECRSWELSQEAKPWPAGDKLHYAHYA
jgi:hypothetical protein